jgi:3-phosphoshikimate 1-carboxyvinyltransferase
VTGKNVRGIEIDMNSLPDCVPALAVVAAFAEGSTTITNIPQLQYKETNRITALARELSNMGVNAEMADDALIIHPGKLRGAIIETYNDHRIAMSFAIAGLCVEGITISNPECVAKSFPTFWDEFKKLESGK